MQLIWICAKNPKTGDNHNSYIVSHINDKMSVIEETSKFKRKHPEYNIIKAESYTGQRAIDAYKLVSIFREE